MKKLFVFALILLLAAPAMALDWHFYGNTRMQTWYQSGKAAGLFNDHDNGNLDVTDSETVWNLAGNARIGAKVKHGTVEGRFEYGSGVNLRLLYGVWKPAGEDGLQVLVGQAYSPISGIFISNQVYFDDEDFLAEGIVYSSRKPQVQFSYKGFHLAFINVNGASDKRALYPTSDGAFDPAAGIGDSGDVDVLVPKIEAMYHYDADRFFFDAYGGYQTFKVTDPLDRFGDVNVRSYAVGGVVGANLGPAYLRVQGNYGQNWGDYGTYNHDQQFWGTPATTGQALALANQASSSVLSINTDAAGNPSYDIQDTTSFGVLGVVGFKFNDVLTFEGGAAFMKHDNDFYINDAKVATYYLQATVTLAKGVFIVPEAGYFDLYDRLDENRSAEDFWYAGAKWQINF